MKKAAEFHADLARRKPKHRYATVPQPVCWLLASGYLIAFGYLLGAYAK